MTFKELSPENIGAACSIFRVEKLHLTQTQFADKHHISNAALSYFERGISLSLNTLFAYIKDGFDEYLDTIDVNDVTSVIKSNEFKKRAYLKRRLADLTKPV